MQTEKDAEIVGWIGCLGAAGAGHVMGRFYMGRSWAYARLSKLVMDGLLEQRTLLYRQPGLYLATADGLRWQGLERLGVYRVSPGGFQHAQEVANAAVSLHRVLPGWEVLSEREIRIHENDQDELIASTRLGELPGGRPALHRPDLALLSPDGSTVAVEVELSVKAPTTSRRDLQGLGPSSAHQRRLLHRTASRSSRGGACDHRDPHRGPHRGPTDRRTRGTGRHQRVGGFTCLMICSSTRYIMTVVLTT